MDRLVIDSPGALPKTKLYYDPQTDQIWEGVYYDSDLNYFFVSDESFIDITKDWIPPQFEYLGTLHD